jgi:hypothetical protein
MADDKGTSQLFGESLPGTGGEYLDTNDVEGHMGNKHITPMPPSADGGPDGIGGKGRSPLPEIGGTDTEGHRKGPGGNIPNLDADAGPEGIGGKGRSPLPEVDGTDTEGHRKGPGGNIPNVDGSPDDFSNKRLFRDFDGGTDDDVEGHGFAKRAPGENPHGDR